VPISVVLAENFLEKLEPGTFDFLAPLISGLGFFGLFAWIGLIAGMACGALLGGLFEMLLRRFGAGALAAVSMATLANALLLWLIAALVHASFPGLRPPAIKIPAPATASPATPNPCANTPPDIPGNARAGSLNAAETWQRGRQSSGSEHC
jgi:predicted lipid-binding transport protein (Tim44 family)